MQKLLNARDIADFLGVKLKTVYAWASSGKLPSKKVGRLVKFSPQELEAWLNIDRRGKPGQECDLEQLKDEQHD